MSPGIFNQLLSIAETDGKFAGKLKRCVLVYKIVAQEEGLVRLELSVEPTYPYHTFCAGATQTKQYWTETYIVQIEGDIKRCSDLLSREADNLRKEGYTVLTRPTDPLHN